MYNGCSGHSIWNTLFYRGQSRSATIIMLSRAFKGGNSIPGSGSATGPLLPGPLGAIPAHMQCLTTSKRSTRSSGGGGSCSPVAASPVGSFSEDAMFDCSSAANTANNNINHAGGSIATMENSHRACDEPLFEADPEQHSSIPTSHSPFESYAQPAPPAEYSDIRHHFPSLVSVGWVLRVH